MAIEVKVKPGKMVFYDNVRRRAGEKFHIKSMKEYSERSMELVEQAPPDDSQKDPPKEF